LILTKREEINFVCLSRFYQRRFFIATASFYTSPKQGLNRAQTGPKHGDLPGVPGAWGEYDPALFEMEVRGLFTAVNTCSSTSFADKK